jgi:ABC-type bacteriocin/lantibiotic exporter with double-glycine peptidase domain
MCVYVQRGKGVKHMLSEERVKLMTRMAMFEKKEGRKLQPAKKYKKRDYISLCTIRGFLLGTLVYGLVYLGILAVLFTTVMLNLSIMNILVCLVLGILLYVLYLFFYLGLIRRRAARHYDAGKRRMKKLRQWYLQLEQIYQKEEAMKIPEGWE